MTHREKRLLAAARYLRVVALRDAVAGEQWFSYLPKHWRASAFWEAERAEDAAELTHIRQTFEHDAALFHEGVPEEFINAWRLSR